MRTVPFLGLSFITAVLLALVLASICATHGEIMRGMQDDARSTVRLTAILLTGLAITFALVMREYKRR